MSADIGFIFAKHKMLRRPGIPARGFVELKGKIPAQATQVFVCQVAVYVALNCFELVTPAPRGQVAPLLHMTSLVFANVEQLAMPGHGPNQGSPLHFLHGADLTLERLRPGSQLAVHIRNNRTAPTFVHFRFHGAGLEQRD